MISLVSQQESGKFSTIPITTLVLTHYLIQYLQGTLSSKAKGPELEADQPLTFGKGSRILGLRHYVHFT